MITLTMKVIYHRRFKNKRELKTKKSDVNVTQNQKPIVKLYDKNHVNKKAIDFLTTTTTQTANLDLPEQKARQNKAKEDESDKGGENKILAEETVEVKEDDETKETEFHDSSKKFESNLNTGENGINEGTKDEPKRPRVIFKGSRTRKSCFQ